MLEPLARAASFGELRPCAEALGEPREDRIIVARLTIWLGDLVHRDHQRVIRARADILALKRHGAGQDDIGVAGRRGPGELVNNERVEPREGRAQAIEILMVMEGVAARPIDQADIGVVLGAAVIAVFTARIEQHVRDARDRDEVLHPVIALHQGRPGLRIVAAPIIADGAERIAIAAAGQADLAERGREHSAHPHRLLAVLGPLQRMRHADQDPPAGQSARERRDLGRRNPGDRRRPGRILRLAVALAEEIALEDRPAFAIAIDEGAVVLALRHERMDERQHQRRVRARHDAEPFGAGLVGKVVAQGADRPELAAALTRRPHGAALHMLADAAACDPRILERHAAEGDHDVCVLLDLLPGDVALGQVFIRAEDVRKEYRRGA